MKKQKIFCRTIMIVWGLSFCALPVTSCMAGHFACAFQRQLSAWENSAGTGCLGGHVCRVWVWDEDGRPIPNIPLYTTWGVLMGATDIDGRAEIPIWADDYNLMCVDSHGSTSDSARLMTTHRPECWGHYSFEVGFLYKTNALNPGEFDLDLNCTWNERAPATQDNDAPYTKSLAYSGVDCTDYWSDQSHWGNWQNPPSYFGQTFIATGDRVVSARVQGTIGGLNLLGWKLRIVTFPALQPVGPDASVPVRWPFGWEAFWGVNDCPVVPGQKYMLQVWRDGGGMNIYHVTENVYPDGHYYEGTTPFPQFDLNGHICCMNYSRPSVLYVDASVSPGGDGRSWANAYNDLQDALAAAQPDVEIRVAQGAYSPEGPLLLGRARNPNPADGATSVSQTAVLNWTAGLDATSHDVYFGTSSQPPFMQNQTGTTFDPGMMAYSTTYYWRIDEVSNGGKTTGTIWSFTTLSAPPPDIGQASNPNPADGATYVSGTADLSWTAGLDATSHDVYFGTSSPPPFMQNQTGTIFDPGTMAYYTTYYWRIDEVGNGGKTTGIIWSFKTLYAPPPMGSNESLENTVTAGDRTATFQLKSGVIIKGGYAGFGEPNADARDIEVYETILSGDLLGNDEPNFANNGENSYHVVTGSNCDQTAILDGFTITAGNANGPVQYNLNYGGGGGMYNEYGRPTLTNCTFSGNSAGDGGGMFNSEQSNPTLTNCTFTGNSTIYDGGAMCNRTSSPTITNCTFTGNSANHGAGISNWPGSPILTACTFSGNSAELGGAVFNWDSSPMLANCMFSNNSAREWGGAISNLHASSPTLANCTFNGNEANVNGGGMFNSECSPTLVNCIFIRNSASAGGGMYNQESGPTLTNCIFSENSAVGKYGDGAGMHNNESSPRLTNCTFIRNKADRYGGAMNSYRYATPTLVNCILWGDAPEEIYVYGRMPLVTYSDVQGGWPGEGNIDAYPGFVQPGYLGPIAYSNFDEGMGPIAYWKFDEGSGTTAYDSAGTNHGTIHGETWTIGIVDRALRFDGVDDYVDVPYDDLLNVTANGGPDFAVEAWIKVAQFPSGTSGDTARCILYRGIGSHGYQFALDVYKDHNYFNVISFALGYPGGGGTGTMSPTLEVNRWYHVVGTYDGYYMFLYLNGVEVYWNYRDYTSQSVWEGSAPLYIGSKVNRSFFDGIIDEAAIYDRALSADEIRQNYLSGLYGQDYPDAITPDYHLLPCSPCINTGDPNYIAGPNETDFDGNPRVIGGRIDMGVYEYLNTRPVADAGSDRTVEAHATWGATVTLDGSGSTDADSTPGTIDDIYYFKWYQLDPCNPNVDVFLGSGRIVDCNLPIGDHIILLEVIDKAGASDTNEVTIIVQDTTPPTITCPSGERIVAYNDCVYRSGDQYIADNVTTYGIGSGFSGSTSGPLVNQVTGDNMGITVTLTEAGGVRWQPDPSGGGSDCAIGTDAYNTFGGIADMTGVIYFGSVGWWVDLTFTGLDPTTEYTFAASAARNSFSGRLTIYTLTGADTYTNAGTIGVDVLAENKVRFNTGNNHNEGYVARWTGITATDGSFTVRAEADPGSTDGRRAYSFDVFMLEGVIPGDVILECPADTNVAAIGSATATDTCGTVTITHSDQWQSGCGNTGTLARTWTATDESGNSSTCVQIITVVDTPPPAITCPPNVTLQCPADTSVQANGSASAGDTCSSVAITHSDQWQPGCSSTGILTRTWTATDECGNSSSCVQTITVVDTIPPAITCPPNVTLQCPADTSIEANGSATAGDTCSSVEITHSDQWQTGCGNTGILTRTWMATDECGNSSSCVQTLTVVDTTPPQFQFFVAPTMLWPPDHKMVLITPSWTVSDECDATPDVSLVSIVANEGDSTIGDGHTSNDIQIGEDGSIYLRSERSGISDDRVYTITYQAVDDCGNATIRSATVSIPHDFKVLAGIASRWLWAGPGRIPEDLNGDGVVNLKDIAIFANNWIQ